MSYNAQISTDAREKVIVGVGVSQCGSDYAELVPAEERVEETMGSAPEQMVTDGGFVSRENILVMEEKGIDLIGPMGVGVAQSAGQMKRRGVDPSFYPEAFHYDAVSDTYGCPAGKRLRPDGEEKRPGRTNYKYRASAADCQRCIFKEKMETEEAKQIYLSACNAQAGRQRGAVAEFPNAWIKEKIGLRQFRLRGLIKVGMEALWACLACNIKQWIRLCWRPQWA